MPTYTKTECITAIQEANSEVEGAITSIEYKEIRDGPSVKTLENKFGSWNEAKASAGINNFEVGEVKTHNCENYVGIRTDSDGYEISEVRTGDEIDRINHHRLLAVAKYGLDAVLDKDVHHKNNIPWDNRHNNIQLLSRTQHMKLHHSPDW